MSFRFWRRIRLLPGVTLNLSKSTASLSFGPPGAKFTLSPRGNRVTAGIPSTGLFYTVKAPASACDRGQRQQAVPSKDKLNLGFFKRLVTPADEEAFVDGLRALSEGDDATALRYLEQADAKPDAAWMAALLHLKRKQFDRAETLLNTALADDQDLGRLFAKYDLDMVVDLPVTDEITAHIRPCRRGSLIALAEMQEARGEIAAARQTIGRLLQDAPDDIVAMVSLAELMLAGTPVSKQDADAVVRMTAGIENETPVHAALLLYKARALRALGMDEVAVKTLTQAYRRKKDRPDDLLRQIRYERALAYADIGRASRSRQELEAIYAETPGFADVRQRLGL